MRFLKKNNIAFNGEKGIKEKTENNAMYTAWYHPKLNSCSLTYY